MVSEWRAGAGGMSIGPMQSTDDSAALVAIRALADAYAHNVDTRQCEAAAELFSADGCLIAHFHPGPDGNPVPHRGRAAVLAALVAGLARYERTTHVVGGQHVALDADGGRARGETVCLAHHVYTRHDERRLLVMAVRYEDDLVHEDGAWRFACRQLRLDWREDRILDGPPEASAR